MIHSRLSETFFFFRQHWWSLSGLILPVLLPASLFINYRFYFLQGGDPGKAMEDSLAMLVQVLAGLYANALVIRYALVETGHLPASRDGIGAVARYLPALFAVQIITGLSVFLGLLLLIVPGVWIMGVLMPAHVLVMAEQSTGLHAIQQAWRRFRPGAWQVAGALAVLMLVLMPLMLLFAGLEQMLTPQPVVLRWFAGTLLDVVGLVCAQMMLILLVRFYDLERSAHAPQSASTDI